MNVPGIKQTKPRSVTLLLHCPLRQLFAFDLALVRARGRRGSARLDAGPLIEQAVLRVTHRHSVQDLIRSGRDLERLVLSRAIRSHIERKIIVQKGRTIVFP